MGREPPWQTGLGAESTPMTAAETRNRVHSSAELMSQVLDCIMMLSNDLVVKMARYDRLLVYSKCDTLLLPAVEACVSCWHGLENSRVNGRKY